MTLWIAVCMFTKSDDWFKIVKKTSSMSQCENKAAIYNKKNFSVVKCHSFCVKK